MNAYTLFWSFHGGDHFQRVTLSIDTIMDSIKQQYRDLKAEGVRFPDDFTLPTKEEILERLNEKIFNNYWMEFPDHSWCTVSLCPIEN